ncbi:MAG: hypothetical protein IJA16_04355 [Clostridia bacterium]|nr:hypothetical protein [Clostridia bacterium]
MRNKFLGYLMTGVIIASALSGCGARNVSETGKNIVPNTQSGSAGGGAQRNFTVELDERSERAAYDYGMADLSLIDTVTGERITLGMSIDEIEKVTGAPEMVEPGYKTYDGVVVKYDKNNRAVSLIVANGKFKDGKETRYFTSRGVGIGTSAEDFKKAYGDSYTEKKEVVDEATGEVSTDAAKAVRYFELDDGEVEFLGTTAPREKDDDYCLQDFMFSNTDGTVATIRISFLSAARGGK